MLHELASPEIWTWIGGAIIAASAIYMTLREVKLKRQAQIPGAPDPAQGAAAPGGEGGPPDQAQAGEPPKPGGSV